MDLYYSAIANYLVTLCAEKICNYNNKELFSEFRSDYFIEKNAYKCARRC